VVAEQCLHRVKAFSASQITPLQTGWECTKSWRRTQPGQLTPTDQRDILYHMMSHSATKAGGRRRKGGCSEFWPLSSQVTITRDGALLSWRWLNICLPVGSSE